MADEDRKARLAALRQQATQSKAGAKQQTDSTAEGGADEPQIRFRNYKPQDSSLNPRKRQHVEKGANDEGAEKAEEDANVEKPAKNRKVEEQDIITKELKELASDEINIVPKKPNWDLKNQVAAKLDKLKRRTQRAIVDILREKVAAEEHEEDGDLD